MNAERRKLADELKRLERVQRHLEAARLTAPVSGVGTFAALNERLDETLAEVERLQRPRMRAFLEGAAL